MSAWMTIGIREHVREAAEEASDLAYEVAEALRAVEQAPGEGAEIEDLIGDLRDLDVLARKAESLACDLARQVTADTPERQRIAKRAEGFPAAAAAFHARAAS